MTLELRVEHQGNFQQRCWNVTIKLKMLLIVEGSRQLSADICPKTLLHVNLQRRFRLLYHICKMGKKE